MTNWTAFAPFALKLLLAGAASAQDAPPAFFDPADAGAVLDALADPEAAFASDRAVLAARWRGLGGAIEEAPFGGGSGECAPLLVMAGARTGVAGLTIEPRRGAGCSPSLTAPSAEIVLKLKSVSDAAGFRTAVEARFGAPDPACSNAERAHWSLKPGLSLRWRTQFDPPDGTVMLIASDPPDANCAVSSVAADRRADLAKVAAFLARVKAEPPPWRDPEGMARWLAPYGKADVEEAFNCRQEVFMPAQATLSGFGTIRATTRPASCPPRTGASDGPPPSLFLFANEGDMFAEATTRGALKSAFGDPVAGCHNDTRDIWVVADGMVAALVSPLWPTFALLFHPIPLSELDCR